MPERSSSIRMSRRSSLAGFRRSVTENPETSELLPTQWEGGLDAICILVGPKMSDPPLEGGVVWIHVDRMIKQGEKYKLYTRLLVSGRSPECSDLLLMFMEP